MNIKSKLLLALLATSSAAFAQTAPAAPEVPEITYNVGVVSQYRYRGIAQTKGDAALQGGVDYANANGFYLGAWGSTIKWIKDAGSNAKGPVELDLYGGYKFEAAGVAYDVGYLRYEYANNTYNKVSGAVNANTDEVYGAATYGVVTAKYSYAFSDLFGTANSKGSEYFDLSANLDLGNGYTLTPHAGRQVIKNSPNSYSDFALTVGKDLGDGLSVSVAAISTTAKKNTFYTSTATSYGTAKNAVVVGVKYAF
ncbi:TorF family putative porin [Limnohabitans sp.]|uniref:TorF family putative porin n=1 Tax=Limnohabitans sp. TaxID=1907725 RepID=UPI00286EB5E6|nr:TorF family putative porin [Limnohabitans sp.]